MKQLVIIVALVVSAVLSPAQSLQGNLNPSSKVVSINTACGSVTVGDAQSFRIGDRVLIIQMQGASLNVDNSSSFGYPTQLASVGVAELNTISSIQGQQIALTYTLQQNYDTQNGSVQLVKVLSGTDLHIQSLKADSWNGTNGGVIAIEATNSVTIDGVLDAGGCGFRGAQSVLGSYNCGVHSYYVPANSPDGAPKGEGISLNALGLRGRGAWANGGGGGNNHNAGGGGGSLALQGGFGGFAWGNCALRNDTATCGIGGYSLDLRSTSPRFYLGGGGGAGHRNDNNPSSGMNGGGIVIVISPTLIMNGGSILCNGMSAQRCEMDGAGGGGAGGTVVLACDSYMGQINVDIRGGNGGDARNPHGPGGGGSGGVLYLKNSVLPSNLHCLTQGGNAGSNYELGGAAVGFVPSHYGATAGGDGIVMSSAQVFNTAPVANSVLSVELGPDQVRCHGNSQMLLAECRGGHGPYSYLWTPASAVDNPTSASPVFTATESTQLHCVVRDALGCTTADSVRIVVTPQVLLVMPDSMSLCAGSQCMLDPQLFGSDGQVRVQWSPSEGLQSASSLQSVCSAQRSTTYHVRVTTQQGCVIEDSVHVEVSTQIRARIHGDTVVCAGSEQIYSVDVPANQAMLWSVQGCVSLTIDQHQHSIHVVWGSGSSGAIQVAAESSQTSCINGDAIRVRIVPQPAPVFHSEVKTLCEGETTMLDAGDFAHYEWSTGDTTRSIRVSTAGTYSVVVRNVAGCESASSSTVITMMVKPTPVIRQTASDNPCTASSITLDAGAFASYRWSTGQNTRSIQVQQDGVYSVVVSNEAGCTSESVSVDVHVGPSRVPSVSGTTSVCAHSTHVYRASGLADSYFSWMVDGAEDVTYMGSRNDSIAVLWSNRSNKGEVKVREVTSAGCTLQQSEGVAIEVISKPLLQCDRTVINVGEGTEVQGPSGYAGYLWSNGETGRSIIVTKECSITLTVANTRGCTEQSDPLQIRMRSNTQPQILTTTLQACNGQHIRLQANSADATIRWSTGAENAGIDVDKTGEYYYTVVYADGSQQRSDTVSVHFWDRPDTVLSREGLLLRAPQAASYQWMLNGQPLMGASNQTCTIEAEGVYQVMCTNEHGCSSLSQAYRYQQLNHVHASVPTLHGAAGSTGDIQVAVSLDGADPLSIPVSFRLECSTKTSLVHVLDPNANIRFSSDTVYWTVDVTCASATVLRLAVQLLAADTTRAAIHLRMVSSIDSVALSTEDGEIVLDGECSRNSAKAIANSSNLVIANIFPNPSTEYADVAFSLTESGPTLLELYDSQAKHAATLIDGTMDRGEHRIRVNTSVLHSGTYLLVLHSPSRTTRRFFNVVH